MARTPKAKPEDKLIDAALNLAAEKPWARVNMQDIASTARVDLAAAYDAFPNRTDMVAAIIARHDAAMLAGDDPSLAEESKRDRIFDVVMRRLDVMKPHKAALKSMICAPGDMENAFAAAPRLVRSARWMLRAAGVPAEGPLGLARAHVMLLVYAATFRAFVKDDSEDLSSTMAVLDKALKRAGSTL